MREMIDKGIIIKTKNKVLCMPQPIQPQTNPIPATMISSSSKAVPFSP